MEEWQSGLTRRTWNAVSGKPDREFESHLLRQMVIFELLKFMNESNNNNLPWWSEEYGFFGSFYMKGDDSKEGYFVV